MRLIKLFLLFIAPHWLLCFLFQSVQAQTTHTDYFTNDTFWRSIIVKENAFDLQIKEGVDTLVAVVSNRVFDYDKIKFAEEKSIDNNQLSYFIAYAKNAKWYLLKFNSTAELLAQLPDNKSLVIFTEGYGKVFTTGVFRAFAMQSQYKVNVLYLDYPSIDNRKNRLANWRFVNKEARKAGLDFAAVLDSVKDYQIKNDKFLNINLFYHSMGNLALRKMIKENKHLTFDDDVWIDNVILNAACVPLKDANKWINDIHFAKRKIIHFNPDDKVLKGASMISMKKQLGMQPKNKKSKDVFCVNFNTLVDQQHSYFVDLPYRFSLPLSIKDYMTNVLKGESPLDLVEKGLLLRDKHLQNEVFFNH